ncbi:hypothetical protein ASE04_09780 [Rhizobium sp. Root708]|uniref:hypothetical protein n=1 Tax=Rhizobium sp. Root708 TaxID=1736592 RepID=UPI0006F9C5CA|nr:hypothetical protein [Rhizobium sp. Root708]KRB51810.1 hypothetical protein ASE04_09780 [Rhizobium sp. Root708]
MGHGMQAPRLNPSRFSTKDLCRLYRVIDNVEETTNMAHQYVRHLEKGGTPTTKYLEELQEFLGGERCVIVDALRDRADPAGPDEQSRLSIVIQFDAWCEEFHKETLDQLAASPLAKEAI